MPFATLCLAAAIYFEARGEPLDAQAAVASVVIERTVSNRYPNTICGVVFQRKQFSAFNNGPRRVRDQRAWDTSLMVARMVLVDSEGISPIQGATHYHTASVRPYWADQFTFVGRSGSHMFYHED